MSGTCPPHQAGKSKLWQDAGKCIRCGVDLRKTIPPPRPPSK